MEEVENILSTLRYSPYNCIHVHRLVIIILVKLMKTERKPQTTIDLKIGFFLFRFIIDLFAFLLMN